MRIVILADPLDNQRAGIHHYTKSLVSHLAEADTENEYFIIRRKKDTIFPAGRQVIIKNHRIPGYAALRMFLLIPLAIRKLKADVAVEPAHFGPFNLPRRIRRVTVIHDLTPVLFPEMHRFHSQLLQRIFLKRILKRASLIITNSLNTSRDLHAYLPETISKTECIYLGRDEEIRYTGSRQFVDGLTRGRPYFFTAGTIEPRKNLEGLLRAFKIYREMEGSHDVMLMISGQRGWKNREFFRLLHNHPYRQDIVLSGYVSRPQLAELYSHALAFVFPSLYEGFGLPVAEAMSCGTPCLLSTRASLPEVGGEAALYFDPLIPTGIADAMHRISSRPELREELSSKAIRQAGKFNWKEHVMAFDRAIGKLEQ
jgi:glycosyltransferase involved in cell wall biosynthesis